jgi:hypothetical protein
MSALVRCPICDLLRVPAERPGSRRIHDREEDQARLKVIVVGAAYLGWSLGSDGFKRALCAPHRSEYIPLLLQSGASLNVVAEEGERE